MSSKDESSSFTENFNDDVNYARGKTGQAQSESQGQRNRATAFTTMNPDVQNTSATGTGTSSQQQPSSSTTETTESTETGWNRPSRYSFTAETLAHPDDKTGPDE